MAEPLRYYHNVTANVVNVLEAMKASRTRRVRPSSSHGAAAITAAAAVLLATCIHVTP